MMSQTKLFVFLVCFWTLLGMIGYIFDAQLVTKTGSYTTSDGVEVNDYRGLNLLEQMVAGVTDLVSYIPVVNVITPLMRLLTYQYVAVPTLVTMFLDATFIFTAYILANVIRGNSG